ncbi:hypothetical protein ACQ4M4_03255 [Leptolyngbya sp. AN02str]
MSQYQTLSQVVAARSNASASVAIAPLTQPTRHLEIGLYKWQTDLLRSLF